MVGYRTTPADRAPLPASYQREPRYLGYRDVDLAKPYARFFSPRTRPIQAHVQLALVAGMSPPEYGYEVQQAPQRLGAPGYEALETGWTRLDSGVVMVSVLTDMPDVTADMWDWWFGWHARETARYKLWHPDAHQFAAVGQDRSAIPGLTDQQRYVGNVSYVDEYIGGVLQPLAIRFLDPTALGIGASAGTTHICARVSLSRFPIAFGWLIHQVRPTEHGAEMRSRFFLNDPQLLDLPAASLAADGPGARLLRTPTVQRALNPVLPAVTSRLMPASIGTDMMFHCAAEMNHLAGILPALHEQFRGQP